MHFNHGMGNRMTRVSTKCVGLAAQASIVVLAGLVLFCGVAWGEPLIAGWDGAYEIYQVQPGDTVENIAARFGISPDLIRSFNALSGSSELVTGGDLAVPLPGLPAKGAPQAPSAVVRMLPPRYAVVTKPGRIMSKPEGGKLHYEPTAGTPVVVKAEQGAHWGVVMVNGSIGWIDKTCVEVSNETISPESLKAMLRGGRQDIVQAAAQYLGTPYRYGGSLPADMDCSLLVQVAYGACGIRLPRTAAAQFEVGNSVNYNELQPGDRLYFINRSGHISHTGIYTDNGQFIHASSRQGCVAVDLLSDPFYWSRFIGARRS